MKNKLLIVSLLPLISNIYSLSHKRCIEELELADEYFRESFCVGVYKPGAYIWNSRFEDEYVNGLTRVSFSSREQLSNSLGLLKKAVPCSLYRYAKFDNELHDYLKREGFALEPCFAMVCELGSFNVSLPTIAVRPIKVEEAAEWVRICNVEWPDTDPLFTEAWIRKIEKELTNERSVNQYFGGYIDDELVSIGSFVTFSDWGYIANITTLPFYRRRGIATALTQRLICYAKERLLDHVILLAESKQNLYSRIGFKYVFDVWRYSR